MSDTDSNPTSTNRIRLTRRTVDAAIGSHTPGRRARHWDSELRQLYLQITPAGAASYCIRYVKGDGRVKADFTIGSASIVAPEAAREAGRARLAALILHGVDPVAERRANREQARTKRLSTFQSVVEDYWEHHEVRETTKKTWTSILNRHLLPRFAGRPITDITQQSIEKALREIQAEVAVSRRNFKKPTNGHRMANMCHEVMRLMFNWAIERHVCNENPVKFDYIFDDTPEKRIRALTDARLGPIWRALSAIQPGHPAEATTLGVMLHILTLQRPYEIIRAHSDDFDWTSSTWRPAPQRTKTNKEYYVPLSGTTKAYFQRVFEISGSPWAFPSPKDKNEHAGQSILRYRFDVVRDGLYEDGELDTSDILFYDARRFGRTQLVRRLKYSKEIAEMVINHKQPSDMSSLYDVEDYSDDVRDAQEAWSTEVIRVGGTPEFSRRQHRPLNDVPGSNVVSAPDRSPQRGGRLSCDSGEDR